jgi:amino acid permease
MLVVLFAAPLTLLPCKDTIEESMLPQDKTFTKKQNLVVTFLITTVCFGISVLIPNIGDAMTILGATTNSAIGFIFPIIFYLKIEKKAPRFSSHKIVAYACFIFICISSCIEISTFIYKKINPEIIS